MIINGPPLGFTTTFAHFLCSDSIISVTENEKVRQIIFKDRHQTVDIYKKEN